MDLHHLLYAKEKQKEEENTKKGFIVEVCPLFFLFSIYYF